MEAVYIKCGVCGKEFKRKRLSAKYCSYECLHKRPHKGNHKQDIIDGNKICSSCGALKSINEFSKDRGQTNGYKCACKKCATNDWKKWIAKNHDEQKLKYRIYHYIKKYRLSEEEAKSLVNDRSGKCEICGEITNIVIDHCHKTGLVRGKICQPCNSVLGYSRDKIYVLEGAIKYLKENASA